MNKVAVVVLILILAGAVGGFYLYGSSSEKVLDAEDSTANLDTLGRELPSLAGLGPEEAYRAMKEEIESAENFDELVGVLTTYASSDRREGLAEAYEAAAESETKEFIYSIFWETTTQLSEIISIEEEIVGEQATLLITTTDPQKRGRITLVREDDAWYLYEEVWGNAL